MVNVWELPCATDVTPDGEMAPFAPAVAVILKSGYSTGCCGTALCGKSSTGGSPTRWSWVSAGAGLCAC